MKKNHNHCICAVESVSYTPERRVMTFTSTGASPTAAQLAVKRRKTPFRLKITMEPQATTSFEPVIKLRTQTKP